MKLDYNNGKPRFITYPKLLNINTRNYSKNTKKIETLKQESKNCKNSLNNKFK